jgi:exonuclease SbcD
MLPRVRLLLLADSHLGFDLPTRPRVERRRRGHDFLANHEQALEPALKGEVDLVVHGGDVFHRSRVPPSLVFQAFRLLVEVAESGVPVFVVPGNHERSVIPHERFASHPKLHLFRSPGTRVVVARNLRVAVSGFPYQRRRIRECFPRLLEDTGWRREEADLRLLCMHHCVEGATVGPSDYTFRHAPDVVRCSDLPSDFAAVLSGHIHRHQLLRQDLQGRPLVTPVLYPGSVERTAFAEMGEEKGFMMLEVEPGGSGGRLVRHDFLPLPARPMLVRNLIPESGPGAFWLRHELEAQLDRALASVPRDAIVRVQVQGRVPPDARPAVAASRIRGLSHPEMNVEVVLEDIAARGKRVRGGGRASVAIGGQPGLGF